MSTCGHSSSPLGSWTPEEVIPLSHVASSGLYPNPSVQDPSQPMRPGCQALFLKDWCYPHHRCQQPADLKPKRETPHSRRECKTKPRTGRRVRQFLPCCAPSHFTVSRLPRERGAPTQTKNCTQTFTAALHKSQTLDTTQHPATEPTAGSPQGRSPFSSERT